MTSAKGQYPTWRASVSHVAQGVETGLTSRELQSQSQTGLRPGGCKRGRGAVLLHPVFATAIAKTSLHSATQPTVGSLFHSVFPARQRAISYAIREWSHHSRISPCLGGSLRRAVARIAQSDGRNVRSGRSYLAVRSAVTSVPANSIF